MGLGEWVVGGGGAVQAVGCGGLWLLGRWHSMKSAGVSVEQNSSAFTFFFRSCNALVLGSVMMWVFDWRVVTRETLFTDGASPGKEYKLWTK